MSRRLGRGAALALVLALLGVAPAAAETTLSEGRPLFEKWLRQSAAPSADEVLDLHVDDWREPEPFCPSEGAEWCYSTTSPAVGINYTNSRPWRRNRVLFWTLLGYRFYFAETDTGERRALASALGEPWPTRPVGGDRMRVEDDYEFYGRVANVYSWCALPRGLQVAGQEASGWRPEWRLRAGKKTKRKVCRVIEAAA